MTKPHLDVPLVLLLIFLLVHVWNKVKNYGGLKQFLLTFVATHCDCDFSVIFCPILVQLALFLF